MATYTNSPCIDAPSSWSVKQLGICSCSIFNCQMYTAQNYGSSSRSGMSFILSTYNGYGNGDSYRPPTNCTGTPVVSSQALNTSTTCVQASDYYSSSTPVFLVAIYTKNLMMNQNNMGGVVQYNSLYGCQNNVLTNVIGEDFNLFGICSLDPSTNNWVKTSCPRTTGINSVSGGFERLNYYANSSCKRRSHTSCTHFLMTPFPTPFPTPSHLPHSFIHRWLQVLSKPKECLPTINK